MFSFIDMLDELNKSYHPEQPQRRQRPEQPRKEHIEKETNSRRQLKTPDINEQIRELEDRILENEIFIKRTQHENEAIEHARHLTLGKLSEDAFNELLKIIEENIEFIDAVNRNQRRLRKELKTLREQLNSM